MHQVRSIAALIACLSLGLFVRLGFVCACRHALTWVDPSPFLSPPSQAGALMRGHGDGCMGCLEGTISRREFFGRWSAMDRRTSICVAVRRRHPRTGWRTFSLQGPFDFPSPRQMVASWPMVALSMRPPTLLPRPSGSCVPRSARWICSVLTILFCPVTLLFLFHRATAPKRA